MPSSYREWGIAREEQITQYDQPVSPAVASAFMRSLARLLSESSLTRIVKAGEDANFVEAVRAQKIDPQVAVGREVTLSAEKTKAGVFAVFRQYTEAAIVDTRHVVGEVNFSGITPDQTEQVSALYVVSVQAAEPQLYTDKLIRISQNSEYAEELRKICACFESNKSHEPNSDLVAVTATIDKTRHLGAFVLGKRERERTA